MNFSPSAAASARTTVSAMAACAVDEAGRQRRPREGRRRHPRRTARKKDQAASDADTLLLQPPTSWFQLKFVVQPIGGLALAFDLLEA